MAAREWFLTPKAAAEACGLTPERIVNLCEKLGCPAIVYKLPTRPDGMGNGEYIIPASIVDRLSAMVSDMDGKMLVRLTGDEDGEDRGAKQ